MASVQIDPRAAITPNAATESKQGYVISLAAMRTSNCHEIVCRARTGKLLPTHYNVRLSERRVDTVHTGRINHRPDDCLVSVLTPPGRSAVATVSVVGSRAIAHVSELFRPAARTGLQQFPIARIVVGRWTAEGHEGEEVVVCCLSQDAVDVHCHGGRTAARRIVDSLIAAGCREVGWQRMAELCEETPIAAEARIALAAARTERTAAILLAQYRGALEAELTAIVALLENEETDAAADRLRRLERYADFGKHLTTPWRVVLTGHANVGKSSLINAILGYERSIVFEQPGTTRDVVTATTAIDGWPVELADTAGLREGGDAVESAGVRLARERLAAADVVVAVFDATQRWTADSTLLAEAWPDAVVVHSKCDLVPEPAGDRPAGLRTSAITGQGIAELVQALASKIAPNPPPPEAAIPFTSRQADAIENAFRLLETRKKTASSTAIARLLKPPPANTLPQREA